MRRLDAKRERMLAVLMQFRILLRSMREHYRSVEEDSRLGGAQLWALAEIAAYPGMSVGDLGRQLAVHLSTASNLVSRLDDLGLVRRKRVGRDQRVVQLAVTPKGREALRTAPRPFVGLLQGVLLQLPPERLDALKRELAEVLRRIEHRHTRAARELPIADLLSGPVPRPRNVPTVKSPARQRRSKAKPG